MGDDPPAMDSGGKKSSEIPSAAIAHAASVKLGHAILSIELLLIPVFLLIYIWLLTRFKGSPEDEIVLKAIRKKFLRGKGKGKKKK